MAAAYVGCALIVILMNLPEVPGAFALIVESAFTGHAAVGGFAGTAVMMAIQFGIARGIFSNEAGLGSAAIAHASAQNSSPVRQGQIAMLGTFIDTLIICTMTALVIIVSGEWTTGASGATLTTQAFNHTLTTVGGDHRRGRCCDLRVHHRSRLEFLRRTLHPVPGRPVDTVSVPDPVDRGPVRRLDLRAERPVAPVRYAQRPDGVAEPDRDAAAVDRGVQADPGNTTTSKCRDPEPGHSSRGRRSGLAGGRGDRRFDRWAGSRAVGSRDDSLPAAGRAVRHPLGRRGVPSTGTLHCPRVAGRRRRPGRGRYRRL